MLPVYFIEFQSLRSSRRHYPRFALLACFFIKTYTILVSITGPFFLLNTLSGIMALQERNEVNIMGITNAAKRFEQRFDAKVERFIWHHPLLGFISIFVGMPLLVLACVCISTIVIAFPMARLLGWL